MCQLNGMPQTELSPPVFDVRIARHCSHSAVASMEDDPDAVEAGLQAEAAATVAAAAANAAAAAAASAASESSDRVDVSLFLESCLRCGRPLAADLMLSPCGHMYHAKWLETKATGCAQQTDRDADGRPNGVRSDPLCIPFGCLRLFQLHGLARLCDLR